MCRALVLWALAAALAPAWALPSFEDVRRATQPSDITLQDRHGAPLQTVRVDEQLRRGPWLSLAELSPALREAIVLGEDRRFWSHSGVDWSALAGAAWGNAWNTRTRGASTLTMQLAGLLDERLARPAGGRSVVQKVTQVARARELEAQWSKTQILEAYLNLVPLRGEVVGAGAGAQLMFGKSASGLDQHEAAVLAALVRAPNADAATVQRRACDLLQQQRSPCTGLAATTEQALTRRHGSLAGATLAPHFARQVMAAGVPSSPLARTTVDARIQRLATSALRQQIAELQGRQVEDGAVVVLDNRSGEVLAWVGSSGPASSAGDVDAVLARRQPGSTLKPFVYGLALERRLVTAASLLNDAPLQLAAGAGLYQPQNYDHAYKGWVSARTALASSLNVPAVRVATMLGPDALFERMQAAGLRLAQSGGWHGYALALGSAEVTLLDLTNAYRAIAQGGRWSPVRLRLQSAPGAPPQRVFEPGVAFLISDILADASARATTFGLDSPLVTRGFAAVKTGTSKDLRDNWCIGFTDRYTVGVWVGNAQGEPMHAVSGVAGAAPVWRQLVMQLHEGQPSRTPAPPAGLVARRVGAHDEWFLAGTEPMPQPRRAPGQAAAGRFGIDTPQEGSVIVLDPDIPMAAQRLVFEGAGGRWVLDGRTVGQGERVAWLPRPGRHVLERHAIQGPAVDRVSFEVRLSPVVRATPASSPCRDCSSAAR